MTLYHYITAFSLNESLSFPHRFTHFPWRVTHFPLTSLSCCIDWKRSHESLSTSRTSQLVRKIGSQNQSIQHHSFSINKPFMLYWLIFHSWVAILLHSPSTSHYYSPWRVIHFPWTSPSCSVDWFWDAIFRTNWDVRDVDKLSWDLWIILGPHRGKWAILVQSAHLWMSQPDFQNQSIEESFSFNGSLFARPNQSCMFPHR